MKRRTKKGPNRFVGLIPAKAHPDFPGVERWQWYSPAGGGFEDTQPDRTIYPSREAAIWAASEYVRRLAGDGFPNLVGMKDDFMVKAKLSERSGGDGRRVFRSPKGREG